MKDKKILISGNGNVALYALEKCNELGARVITLSDSKGVVYYSDGIKNEKINYV